MTKFNTGQGAGAKSEAAELVKSQPVGRVDPEWKRQAFLALKEANDQGRLVPAKRKKFSPKVRQAVWDAYDGLCARCEEPLSKPFDIDHIIEHDLMGPDDLDNLVPLHPACHRPKTSERAPVLAKVHRNHKTTYEPKPEPKRPIKNRPFEGWRNMRGEIVRRGT